MKKLERLNVWVEKDSYVVKSKAQHYLSKGKETSRERHSLDVVNTSACDGGCGSACGSSCDCAGACS